MRRAVQGDMGDTIQATNRFILPLLTQIHPDFKGRRHHIVEDPNAKDPVRQRLDTLAGIDIEQYHERGMRGIASRVQFECNFRTFTIRTKRPQESITEYEKRLYAIQHKDEGYLYPYWTLHSYIANNEVLSLGIAKTSELYPYVAQQEAQGHKFKRKQTDDGEEFLYVPWWQYQRSNNYIYIYTKQSQIEQVHYQMKAKYEEESRARYSLPIREHATVDLDIIWKMRQAQYEEDPLLEEEDR